MQFNMSERIRRVVRLCRDTLFSLSFCPFLPYHIHRKHGLPFRMVVEPAAARILKGFG